MVADKKNKSPASNPDISFNPATATCNDSPVRADIFANPITKEFSIVPSAALAFPTFPSVIVSLTEANIPLLLI